MKKILLSVLIMVGTSVAFAQVPGTISYQGILVKTSPPADAGKPVDDGVHFVQFHFYNAASGGTALYSSTGTGSGNSVTTYKGMFTFLIGSGSAGNLAIPSNIFNQQLYVEVIADGVTLSPRIPLSTAPYAFAAQSANSVAASNITGTIGSTQLADGAVTLVKHADNSVNSAKIVDGSVATVDLADGSVTLVKHADNSVNSAKIADGSVATVDLADNSVTSAKIVDGTISNADINASAAIAVTKLASGTNGQILTTSGGVPTWTTPAAGGTVTNVATGTGLTGGPITTTGTISIANLGVTTALLADNAVTSAKIVDGTIATADIADGSITAAKLASGATLTGSGAANRVAFWSGTNALSSSSTLTWNGTNFGIGPSTASNFLHVAADVGGSSTVATFEGHSATASRGPGINFLRSKGSVASPSTVADGDYLAGIGALGRTASAYNISSGIQFEVDGTVSATSVPGRITFSTTNAGSSSSSEKMRLTNNGNLGLGIVPDYKFSVFGSSASAFNGPNMSFITSQDAYPVMHFLNWSHSEQWMLFNAYYDGSFKSSASSNFAIRTDLYSAPGRLFFSYNNGVAAGTNLSWFNGITLRANGNVGINTDLPTTTLEVNGYTKLGSSAPGIRTALFTGTTASTQGGTTSITLTGITGAQILSIDVMVEWSTNSWLSQGYYNPGYKFYWYSSGSTIFVINDTSQSGSILSRPIRVFVIYQP